jgi:hypothetical protein
MRRSAAPDASDCTALMICTSERVVPDKRQ